MALKKYRCVYDYYCSLYVIACILIATSGYIDNATSFNHFYTLFCTTGVTFDTGGISIKPSSGMGLMRGDMGGAACVVSSLLALAELGYEGSVLALTPLCENMPSGNAIKPGDVVVAKNGKSIEVIVSLSLADTVGFLYSLPFTHALYMTYQPCI